MQNESDDRCCSWNETKNNTEQAREECDLHDPNKADGIKDSQNRKAKMRFRKIVQY